MQRARHIILVLGDIFLAYLALVATVYLGFGGKFSGEVLNQHLLPFSILYLCWLIIFYIFGLYTLDLIRPKLELGTRTGEALLICLIIGVVFFYTIPLFKITPKTNLLINLSVFGILVFLWRRGYCSVSSSFYLRNIGILGKTSLSKAIVKKIESNPQLGYNFKGFLEDKSSLFTQIKNKELDLLIIAKDLTKDKKLAQNLYSCLSLKVEFLDLAQAYELLFYKIPLSFVEQNWFLENLGRKENKIYRKIKRILDIAIVSGVLIVSSPLWLIFAIAIKIEDRGPVFYKQERIGKNQRKFLLWKFRSMIKGAEKDKALWAKRKDSRITKIGQLMRTLHLDELPQTINVLKGDLTLVGPRPERPKFVKKLKKKIPHYHLRHIVKPGVTGWAQIKFRYARSIEDSRKKLQYDLYYIKNRSFFLDLGILLKTFQLFFKRGG